MPEFMLACFYSACFCQVTWSICVTTSMYFQCVLFLFQIMFLSEVEELLELIDIKEFPRFIEPLFQQIARSVLSPHYQVMAFSVIFYYGVCVCMCVCQ